MLASGMLCSHAQSQEVIAKFKITEAKMNGIDMTQYYYDRKQYFVFYQYNPKEMCFASVSSINNDQSYGSLHSETSEKKLETETSYASDIFNFRWKYKNSYDGDSGYATICFTKIYKPTGVLFSIKMITQKLDVLTYIGYMEGTLNFQDYIK